MVSPVAIRLELINTPVTFDDAIAALHAFAVSRSMPVICEFDTLNSDSPYKQDVIVHPDANLQLLKSEWAHNKNPANEKATKPILGGAKIK